MIITAHSNAQTWQWARTSKQCYDPVYSVLETFKTAIDGNGNLYAVGNNAGTCTVFGTDTIHNISNSTSNMFLVKHDSLGNYKWSLNSGYGSIGVPQGVATDVSGNVYWTGVFTSPTVTFGSYTLTTTFESGFLVKCDSTGNVLWAKKIDQYITNTGLATSPDGSVYVIGSFLGAAITADTFSLPNSGPGSDLFLLKYDAAGNVVWARRAGTLANNDEGFNVSCDGIGNVYIQGVYQSSLISFGSVTLVNADSSRGNIFVAKYNSSGTPLWARQAVCYGGASSSPTANIKADNLGNLYFTGSFNSDSFVIGTYVFRNDSLPEYDLFLAKMDPLGNLLWAQRGGGKGNDAGSGMTVDAVGNLWLVGGTSFENSMVLDTAHLHVPASNDASFIAEFSPAGHIMYHTELDFGGDDYFGIETDHNGNIYIGGDYYQGSYYLGVDTLHNYGVENFIVAKLGGAVNLLPLNISTYVVPQNISIFPNPATNEFCITTEVPIGNSSVSITNTLGQEVKDLSIVSATTKIPTTDMPSGMYICKVMVNGNISVHKLVVR